MPTPKRIAPLARRFRFALVKYCASPFSFRRRASRGVQVGNVGIGGNNPIRVQSMITCDTMDTQMSIQQTIELANVGCEIVRITAPAVKEARNLENIMKGLREHGCNESQGYVCSQPLPAAEMEQLLREWPQYYLREKDTV